MWKNKKQKKPETIKIFSGIRLFGISICVYCSLWLTVKIVIKYIYKPYYMRGIEIVVRFRGSSYLSPDINNLNVLPKKNTEKKNENHQQIVLFVHGFHLPQPQSQSRRIHNKIDLQIGRF